MSVRNDLSYALKRAEEEAIIAINSEDPAAAAVHRRLSALYSARALMKLAAKVPASTARRQSGSAI